MQYLESEPRRLLLIPILACLAALTACDKSEGETEDTAAEATGSSGSTSDDSSESSGSGSGSSGESSGTTSETGAVAVRCGDLTSELACEGATQDDLVCAWRRRFLVDVSGGSCSVEQTDGCVAQSPGGADPGCGPLEGCDEFAKPSYQLAEDGTALFIERCANPETPEYTEFCGWEDLTEGSLCACACAGS